MNFLSSRSGSDASRIEKARELSRTRRRSKEDRARETKHAEVDSDAASSSPWTGVGSPLSSDFEAISDSEVHLNQPPPRAEPNAPYIPLRSSNLSRSLARRNSSQSGTMSDSGSSTPDTSALHSGAGRGRGPPVEVGGGADGDDEQSALEDDESRIRGRGRTRKREEDPAMRKSMLEDALRSSLATLLSLSSQHATLSPAMSSASLSSLFTPQSPLGSTSPRRFPPPSSVSQALNRASPFAFALSESDDTEAQDQAQEDAREWNEDDQSLSEEAVEFYSENSDEGTQLGPRTSHSQQKGSSRAIPIPASTTTSSRFRERSQSDSLPNPSAPFSPIQSRPLALGPSSASPPVWSRRRRRRGQRHASMSPAPAPASLEERRRARARGATDAEESGVEPDQGFLELVDSAKAFMSMPTRLSGSLPGSTTHTAPEVEHHHHPTSSTLFTSALGTLSPVPRPPLNWHHRAPSSPSSSFPSSDPFLPSSVPDLSSGPDELSSPGVKGQAKGGKGSSSTPSEKATAQGWFAWLGKTVEIKVWHLVGLCGLLVGVGVGIGASSLLKHTTRASRVSLF